MSMNIVENGEFQANEIGEFVLNEADLQDITELQKQMDPDETMGYVNIIDEDQRAPTDQHKNIPRVQSYQLSQFKNQSQLQTIANFYRYQFPEFFNKNIPQKNVNNRIKQGSNSSENGSTDVQKQENEEINSNNDNSDSQDEEIIKKVVQNIISIAGQEQQEQDVDQSNNDGQKVLTPRTFKDYQTIRASIDGNIIMNNGSNLHVQDQNSKQQKIPSQKDLYSTKKSDLLNQSIQSQPVQCYHELSKEGYNTWLNGLPQKIPVDKDTIFQYNVPEVEYCNLQTKEQIFDMVKKFNYYPNLKDEKRTENCYKSGGKRCVNDTIVDILRSTAKTIIKQVGRKLLNGEFNLTQVSFPIKVMIPLSGLEKALYSTCLFPFYLNRASLVSDPIERLKLLICASLGHFYINLSFLKPLNPILGETCQGSYPDGTELYAEQISHHPPISYFTVYGPDKSYKMWGNYHFASNAGLNSLTLKNSGKRQIVFKDGQSIEYNFGKEKYTGSFWGTMRTECEGKMVFKDQKNNIEAKIEFDKVSGKPSDYIKGWIKQNDKKISEIYGSYMGFLEFDGIRYWDQRETKAFKPNIQCSYLGSDHLYRSDMCLLQRGQIELAQQKKEELEQLQRADRALRTQMAADRKVEEKKAEKQQKKAEKELKKNKK